MAKGKINDVDKASKDIKNTFAEIGNLINELNNNLSSTSSLTKGVADNLSQSTDLSKEFMDSEVNVKNLKEKVAALDDDKLKKLQESLKTGKGLNQNLTKELGLQDNIGKLAGAAAKKKLEYLGVSEKVIKKQILGNNLLKAQVGLQKMANAVMDVLFTQLMAVDKETTAMARGLNMSKEEAIGVKEQFAQISRDSGDIAINSIRLGKAQAGLNAQLGMGTQFSGQMLKTFSKLTEIVGISAEAAGSLAFQGQMAGQSFREVEENVLAASYEMQRGVGIQLDMKGVLEATGKVSGQVRANLGANPELIAKAVTAAKLLGAELSDIAAAGKTMLNFESSIEAELEAELLTGKQLNLEKARAAALAGDQVALAEELGKNIGSHGDFMKMNVLQQDALAKAMGMSSDSMADMLFKQETMGMNAKQLRAQGKGELADKLEQLDAQEKMALAQEKFQAVMGEVAMVVLPVVEAFGQMVSWLAESKVLLGALVGIIVSLAVAQKALALYNFATATAKIFASNLSIGPWGIVGALAGVAALGAAIGGGAAMIKDGHAPASKGPFTITDNYGAMAKTTPGDNLQVGPGVGKGSSSAPVVIQNNWDAFAASNGNGRKGLGGTQSLQASPTFA